MTFDDIAKDFAVVQLREDLKKDYGHLGFGYACATQTYGCTTAGYPADRSPDQSRQYWTQARLSFGGCVAGTAGVVSSNMDSYGGQSGSSLWAGAAGGLTVRAIHSSAGNGLSYHRSITREVFNLVKAWRDSPAPPA